jgi:lia operon protein LiaI
LISAVIMYYAFKGFMKAESSGKKIMWAIFGVIAFAVTVSNVPAIMGVVAAYILYLVYKKWNETKVVVKEESDPFTNFEKEWAELKKNF